MKQRMELRRRVEARKQQLEEALRNVEKEGYPADRIAALGDEINVVNDCLTGGWESISEPIALRLGRWLQATEVFVASARQERQTARPRAAVHAARPADHAAEHAKDEEPEARDEDESYEDRRSMDHESHPTP